MNAHSIENYWAILLCNMQVCKILVYVHVSEDPLLLITSMLSSAQLNERRQASHVFDHILY